LYASDRISSWDQSDERRQKTNKSTPKITIKSRNARAAVLVQFSLAFSILNQSQATQHNDTLSQSTSKAQEFLKNRNSWKSGILENQEFLKNRNSWKTGIPVCRQLSNVEIQAAATMASCRWVTNCLQISAASVPASERTSCQRRSWLRHQCQSTTLVTGNSGMEPPCLPEFLAQCRPWLVQSVPATSLI
jgi:hypothetical protein